MDEKKKTPGELVLDLVKVSKDIAEKWQLVDEDLKKIPKEIIKEWQLADESLKKMAEEMIQGINAWQKIGEQFSDLFKNIQKSFQDTSAQIHEKLRNFNSLIDKK